jgi:hypothetical protein
MNKCKMCNTWYEVAKDSEGKEINPTFCESCLEGKKLMKLEKDSLEKLWSEYSNV